MAYKSENSDGLVNKSIDAMPRWALAVMCCLFALTIFLTFSGFDNAFQRVTTAYAVRIEKSVESLEDVAKRLDNLEAGHNRLSIDLRTLEKRVDSIEAENKQYHKGK